MKQNKRERRKAERRKIEQQHRKMKTRKMIIAASIGLIARALSTPFIPANVNIV